MVVLSLFKGHGWLSAISALGFALSLGWHVMARLQPGAYQNRYWLILFASSFIVMLPTGFYVRRFIRQLRGRVRLRAWSHLLTGAPPWFVWLTVLTVAYVLVEFLVISAKRAPGAAPRAASVDVFASGLSMICYSFAALINWAAVRRLRLGLDWVCERGHALVPGDKKCSECGAAPRARG